MKSLPFTPDQLREITAQYPTPFYIYDEKAIRENARRLHQAFSWNPGYREFFAVKSTPNPAILSIFREEGCGVDCASETELLLAQRCGFSGSDIMFSSNNTPAWEYELAQSLSAIINLDDTGHTEFLEKTCGLPELICCRYNPGIDIIYQGQIGIRFGNSRLGATREQILDAFPRLQKRGVQQFAIHSQFGGHHREADYFGQHIRLLFDLAADIFRETGIRLSFINFAGGLGIPYRPEDAPADIHAVSQAIRHSYEDILLPAGLADLPLYSEFGLYMTGPHGYFVTSVQHLKHTYQHFAGLDGSTNSFMSPLRYSDYHHVSVPGKDHLPPARNYSLTGALCEDRDRFAVDRPLPILEVGDHVVFHDAGAYTFCQGHNFNGKLRPAELLLAGDGSVRMIRRAETPADYFTTLDCSLPALS